MNIKTVSTPFLIIIMCAVFTLAPHNTTQAQDVAGDLLGRINNLRASLGIPAYTPNSALSAAARNHAQWMVQTGQISHTQTNGSTPSSRASAAGYSSSWVSENIYMGTNATAASAFTWWTNSPVHYRGMTSTNYTEIGIGWASGGDWGSAFVLVFGNPGGWQSAPSVSQNSASSGASNSSNAGAPSGPPPFVVGVDNVGNIMHEIQPGHTLGEIALIYGYTWDDLQRIRDLNTMTEEEGRNLEVGAVLLIPPYEGTYTPTPGGVVDDTENTALTGDIDPNMPYAEDASVRDEFDAVSTPRIVAMMGATATPEAPVIVASPSPQNAVITTTNAVVNDVTPREDVANPPIVESSNVTQPSNWTAATVTPTAGLTEVAMVEDPQTDGLIPPATVDNTSTDDDDGGLPPMLYVIIGVQIGIVSMAGFEYLRRRGN